MMMKVSIVQYMLAYSSGKFPFAPSDPFQIFINAHEALTPLTIPSQFVTLVLLAPFVVWGYLSKPCNHRSTN